MKRRTPKKSQEVCRMLTLLLLLSSLSFAQSSINRCPPLRVGDPAGNYVIPGVKGEIVYHRVGGATLALDAYVQQRGVRRPAVVVIHGGGWDTGSRAAFIGQFLEMLTRAGYNWFAVDYRLGGLAQHGAALADLRAALAFIRCHAREFRIDPDRLALLGEDAGAHLAALLASEKPAGIKATVLIGGFYDLREHAKAKATLSAELLAQASPITRISAGMPQSLIVHGAADNEAPAALAENYAAALRAAAVPSEYLPVAGAIHRAENWLPQQWGYKERVLAWLGKVLAHTKPEHEPYATNLQKEIVFSPRYGLKLDAYTPPGRGPFPAVLIAHGGGWEAGDRVTYVTPLFKPLAEAGFAWFSVDYRLTPEHRHPAQLEDLREALRFVRANAQRFKLDPQRLALLGESASGQLVTQLATEKPAGVAAVVSFYGVYDFAPLAQEVTPRSIPARLFGLSQLDEEARALLRRYSPLHNAQKDMPPLLLIHGTNERLWAQGEAFAQRLAELGAPHELYAVRGAPHGLENWEGHPEWLGYKAKLVEWLKARLSK